MILTRSVRVSRMIFMRAYSVPSHRTDGPPPGAYSELMPESTGVSQVKFKHLR